MSKKVLCLLASGFEEIETITPIDLLRRAGAEVTVAALGDNLLVTGRSNITVQADALLEQLDIAAFDLLFLPGGPGVKGMREDGRPAALARDFASAGKTVTAICAAPTILHDAGLLTGKAYTSHFSVRNELAAATDDRVVVDSGVITSRGAGTALDFGLELVRELCGPDKATRLPLPSWPDYKSVAQIF